MDWSLKTVLRFSSHQRFACCEEALAARASTGAFYIPMPSTEAHTHAIYRRTCPCHQAKHSFEISFILLFACVSPNRGHRFRPAWNTDQHSCQAMLNVLVSETAWTPKALALLLAPGALLEQCTMMIGVSCLLQCMRHCVASPLQQVHQAARR